MTEDFYRTLNVDSRATPEEIQRAYRALARRYHPDHNPLPAAATLMATINAAYEVLSEPLKRAAYDRRAQKKPESPIDQVVLSAARDHILHQGWELIEERPNQFLLKSGSRHVHVAIVRTIDHASLRELRIRSLAYLVVLTVHVDPAMRMPSTGVAVIDLMRSRLVGGEFPDSTYQSLFTKLTCTPEFR